MSARPFHLSDELHDYLISHCTAYDPLARDLAARTRSLLPDRAVMQVPLEQAAFLTLLTRLSRARQALEVGTFTGMSSLAIARACRRTAG